MGAGDGGRRWGQETGLGYMKIPPIKKAIAVVKYAIAFSYLEHNIMSSEVNLEVNWID